ncbi:uncharacterized protein LOC113645089 isoform X2 [Tachysurus fulvidraco]|uniref:uncharacterized protein LOC113645089 isoform X2 n=1 Tax=Tachysurus fulvidraco TaxID=1234273 RepID=UPI001FF05451|nr:uncharacterized protein LOC113645089 isoform X2 [Tachysurus fulvidraco]
MNQRTFFLLVVMGFCAMWQKADAQIIVGKPELSGPLISVIEDIVEFFCKLDHIQTNETILYQLFHESNLNEAMAEYSTYSKEEAKFVIIVALAHDGRLMCNASVQNNSNISSTFSNWMDFQVLVPVNGAHVISSPSSSEDFWEKDDLTLKCNITSGTYVSYEWFLNDSLIHNDSNVLHISNLSDKHNGKYVCVAKNYLDEAIYYNSTSKERNVHVKEYLSKPEISIEVIKNTDGNISARVKCHVTKGSPPINFVLFKNNHIVHAVTSGHKDALFTLPIALDQDMGTVYCQANNGKHPLHSRELNLKHEDDEDDDEETTSAVTEVDNAGRSTECIPRDLPTHEGSSTSAHNLSRLPANELYKVHLQKQIRKSDMEMDLIQLQMEEKRLLIKKAALEIELLEHRLKEIKK